MVTLRAVVHIGPMKTGTTAFAAACTRAERAGSMPDGLLYPIGDLWFTDHRSVVKHPQANAPARAPHAAIRANNVAQSGIADFERAIHACTTVAQAGAVDGTATTLIVAEGLSHQLKPEGLTEVLGRHFDTIDYVLVPRTQARAVGSMMVHGVKDIGAPGHWQLDVATFLASPVRVRRFDYARIIDRWRHNGATLHVIPFDESAPGSTTMTDAILDRVGLPRLSIDETESARRLHPSFSADGLRELARIKHRHAVLGWIPGADRRYRESFRAAWLRHHGAARTGSEQPWRLSAAGERTVAAAYAASNRRLFEQLAGEALTPTWRDWFAAVGIEVDAVESRGNRL